MERPYSATGQNNNGQGVGGAVYNAAGQLLSMPAVACCYTQQYLGQSFTYNSMGQLTGTSGAGGAINIQYNYSATQNNGKIISQVDMVSGEQVNFTYDALNRLATAQTAQNSNVTQWGQSFTYDGFGNLTNVNVIAGSAPTYSANYNAATNQQYSDCADANGNLNAVTGGACTSGNWYDVENRLLSPNSNAPVYGSGGSTETWYYYSYAPGNKRVWRGSWQEQIYNCQPGGVDCQYSWSRPTDIVAFYAPNGQRLAGVFAGILLRRRGRVQPRGPGLLRDADGDVLLFWWKDVQEPKRVGLPGPAGLDRQILSLRRGAPGDDRRHGEVHGLLPG